MIKKILCGLFILFLYACNDEQINKNILSNNSALSKEQLEHSNSLDINSYKEIAIFLKTIKILFLMIKNQHLLYLVPITANIAIN